LNESQSTPLAPPAARKTRQTHAKHRHELAAFHSIICAIAFSYSNEL
jgi:hypothetical protein